MERQGPLYDAIRQLKEELDEAFNRRVVAIEHVAHSHPEGQAIEERLNTLEMERNMSEAPDGIGEASKGVPVQAGQDRKDAEAMTGPLSDAAFEAAGRNLMDRAVEALAREMCGQRHHLPLDDLSEAARVRIRAEARAFTEGRVAEARALLSADGGES